MMGLLDEVLGRLDGRWKRRAEPRPGHSYRCRCGRPVFFRNSRCLGCGAELGYDPAALQLLPLEPAELPGSWRAGAAGPFRRCANFELAAGCNWLLPAEAGQPLCRACRLNRTIPDLSIVENHELWQRCELAKRRLVAQLLALGLPVESKVEDDPERGLAFDFLRTPAGGPRLLTGHTDGIITINIEEADDAIRERMRNELREPYRTLLGHLRHEVGHYYFERLVVGTRWHAPCRELFGDERADYRAALQRNYEEGAPAGWAQRHISSYAAVHPWEDWAETWAHYLHIADSLRTALGCGLDADDIEIDTEPFGPDALWDPTAEDADRFLQLLNAWVELTMVLNELARSMGQRDIYPFVLAKPVVAKLQLIHLIVRDAAGTGTAPA